MPSLLYQIPEILHNSWLNLFVGFLLLSLVFYHLLMGFMTWYTNRKILLTKQQEKLSKIDLKKNKKIVQKRDSIFKKIQEKRQREKLVQQLPLFLQILSSTLRAGYSFPQSLVFAEREISAPLRPHIQKLNQDLAIQIPLPKALQHFADSINHPEIDFFTRATCIQIQTGGNIITLFGKLGHIIQEKMKLQRDIKSFTSQGKMSGLLIAGLWPCSLLIFWWLSPQHTEVLFTTSTGNFLLALSILLEIIGFWMIWRIISIKL